MKLAAIIEALFPVQRRFGLELFARDGSLSTCHWASVFHGLAACEINEKYADDFSKRFPQAQVLRLDTIRALCEGELAKRLENRKFHFISADSPQGFYGDGYCEHFDYLHLLPEHAEDRCIFYFNVNLAPYKTGGNVAHDDYGMKSSDFERWQERREAFYGKSSLSFSDAVNFYKGFFREYGFKVAIVFPFFRASALEGYPDHILYLACLAERA